ncbi:uncharacterized protein J3D65DRAFT_667560 [Phyllosticta citribraziliensis]|uniref:Uncharacterized protein n=1 Tax=Phyllosticta citribraziliensis TaxID=989973 RepID=A0ABR1LNS2_9PEZI
MPSAAEKLPYPTNFQKWNWGDDLPPPAIAKRKQDGGVKTAAVSVTSLHNAKWSIYNAKIEISEDVLPPANVVLSDRIAYDLSQFLADNPIIVKSKLCKYWPGNYDTRGNLIKSLHPVGSPALHNVDGKPAYAVSAGRIWIGEPGLIEAEKEAESGSVAMVRQTAPWWKPTDEEMTSGYSFRWSPGKAKPHLLSPDWDRLPSSLLNEAELQPLLQSYDVDQLRASNGKVFGKNVRSPSHPDRQAYKSVVDQYKIEARNKRQAVTAASDPTFLEQHIRTATNLIVLDADVGPRPFASNTAPVQSQIIVPTPHVDRLSRHDSFDSEPSVGGSSSFLGSNTATASSNTLSRSVQQAHHITGAPDKPNEETLASLDEISAIIQTTLRENTNAVAKLERACSGNIPDTEAILKDITDGREQASGLWSKFNELGASVDRLNDLQEEVNAVKEQMEKSNDVLRKVQIQLTSQANTGNEKNTGNETTSNRSLKRKSRFSYIEAQSPPHQRPRH